MTPTPFWQLFHAPRDTVALIEDGGATLTYGELAQQVGQVQAHLPRAHCYFAFARTARRRLPVISRR
ncbi:hypothetical protein BN137_1083 [Cronobacter condimenti 1330]|uniref:Uncharacterized protein n=1 Tax=Cronobacter condimenti 1330 TaxID=1073999 RepID=K7ZYN5_9ENTR|nr:hypothetical protein [Cronobacter condimenti]CCJ71738.1 hypothetical protein BN137_1083 [Cronobacter condimenti 1330]